MIQINIANVGDGETQQKMRIGQDGFFKCLKRKGFLGLAKCCQMLQQDKLKRKCLILHGEKSWKKGLIYKKKKKKKKILNIPKILNINFC